MTWNEFKKMILQEGWVLFGMGADMMCIVKKGEMILYL